MPPLIPPEDNAVAHNHWIKFYPVGNGDTAQIVLANGRRILLDFCHRQKAEDPATPEIDLKKTIRDELKAAKRDYFDVVAFTHADLDHIQGSTDFFELRHAAIYQGGDRIKISELWVPAAMLLEEADKDQLQDEFVLLRQEARHRLLEGKGILVFSQPQALMDWLMPKLEARGEAPTARDHLFIDAGTIVPTFQLDRDGVEFFCHSPFIKHCDGGDIIRNSASLIFNVRFRVDGAQYDYLAVGDATWEDLEDIVRTTQYHKNDDRLAWNLYNIPHHCSYLALSDDKGDKETAPKPLVAHLLLQGQPDAYMVSSSCPIPNSRSAYSDIQPPHIQARNAYERYLKSVGGRKFLVTMEEPNAAKPAPIVFEVSSGGITLEHAGFSGAPAILRAAAPRAGSI
jgi:hypothetical protein